MPNRTRLDPIRLIIVGGVLLVIGAVLPFLMFMQFIKSTLFLNGLSAFASIAGMLTGSLGIFEYTRRHKDQR